MSTFIKSRGHLPGVPSAAEVVRDGVDVGAMQAKLLEKVEELTLYIIKLEEKVEMLEQNANRLKRKSKP